MRAWLGAALSAAFWFVVLFFGLPFLVILIVKFKRRQS